MIDRSTLRPLISIPALREEGDISSINYPEGTANFYPRPPRGGRRAGYVVIGDTLVFLSPPSARRATDDNFDLDLTLIDFYPRPPRGGRRDL